MFWAVPCTIHNDMEPLTKAQTASDLDIMSDTAINRDNEFEKYGGPALLSSSDDENYSSTQ